MALDFAEDLLESLSCDDHGVEAIFNCTTIEGILDNAYEDVAAGGPVPFAMSHPHFSCRTTDVPGVARGDTLTIGTVIYTIRNIEPDGTGLTVLMLESP